MDSVFKKISIIIVAISFVNCADNTKFRVAKGTVGQLTSKTTIKQLKAIFANDSIVKNLSEGDKEIGSYMQDEDEYLIYEKGGKHLLTITPKQVLDSVSTIKSVQVFDQRYKTEKGVNVNSTFQDVNASFNISATDINVAFNSVSVHLKSINADIALDKDDLGIHSSGNQDISPERIPDLSKVKSFIVWFN